MNEIPLSILFTILGVLILLSAFFSSSETALMTLNRYRMKTLAEKGHRGAILARRLLKRPDRLLGLILLGNNAVNIAAASLATVIAVRMYGEVGIAIATFGLTFVLIFAEVAPKTLAALRPERVAFPAAYVYTVLLKVFYPFVWMVNTMANQVISLAGINPEEGHKETINTEEVRAVVNEARHLMPKQHSDMLLRILDLENTSVEDIMIPRSDITGIDLSDDWIEIERQISNSHRTRVPVFHDSIDNIVGMLHLRKVLNLLSRDELDIETLKSQLRDPYFIPEGTLLTQQLLNFQKNRRRSGLVVDEYGSIMGLVTLEDILEEIVGQFTTDASARNTSIHLQSDGSYLVDGSTHIREINRNLGITLPTDGPKTLNGLILEHLEMIPEPGTSLMINEVPIEITRTSNNAVHMAKLSPITDNENTDDSAHETQQQK